MCRRRAVCLFAAVLSNVPFMVHAEPASDRAALPVALEFSGCDALDQRESLKLLAIEFRTLDLEARTPLEHVRIRCDRSVARITIDERPTSNEVQLAATSPSAWPRLLALSVSELVIESRSEVVTPSPPSPRHVLPVPPGDIAHDPQRPARKVRLFAAISALRALRSATWLPGFAIGVEFAGTRHLSLVADARLEFGTTQTDVAKVRWLSTRAVLGALIGDRMGAWQLGLGPQFSLGSLRLSPTVKQPGAAGHVVAGAWGGPQLTARAAYDFSERCFVRLNVDIGVVVLPVKGQVNGGRSLVDAGGVWIASGLAGGVLF
jgi:hypothetical protein